MFGNIYSCFPILSVTWADDPDLSVALTRSTATLRSPDVFYTIRRNCSFSQGDPDSNFPLWTELNIEWYIFGTVHVRSEQTRLLTTPLSGHIGKVVASHAVVARSILLRCTDLYYARGASGYLICSEKWENNKNSTHIKIKFYIIFILIVFSTMDIKIFTYRSGAGWGVLNIQKKKSTRTVPILKSNSTWFTLIFFSAVDIQIFCGLVDFFFTLAILFYQCNDKNISAILLLCFNTLMDRWYHWHHLKVTHWWVDDAKCIIHSKICQKLCNSPIVFVFCYIYAQKVVGSNTYACTGYRLSQRECSTRQLTVLCWQRSCVALCVSLRSLSGALHFLYKIFATYNIDTGYMLLYNYALILN